MEYPEFLRVLRIKTWNWNQTKFRRQERGFTIQTCEHKLLFCCKTTQIKSATLHLRSVSYLVWRGGTSRLRCRITSRVCAVDRAERGRCESVGLLRFGNCVSASEVQCCGFIYCSGWSRKRPCLRGGRTAVWHLRHPLDALRLFVLFALTCCKSSPLKMKY